jgi:hypothetical protein
MEREANYGAAVFLGLLLLIAIVGLFVAYIVD